MGGGKRLCGPRVLHAKDIVEGTVVELAAVIEAMHSRERHSFVTTLKDRRLVHIIPEAGDAHADEILV